MMVQIQCQTVLTALPPAHPNLKRGAGEGCISVSPTLPTPTTYNSAFYKIQDRKVKTLLNKLAHKNDFRQTKTANSHSQIQIAQNLKSSSETDLRKKNRIKKLE